MAEFCLDCFLKYSPSIPREKIILSKEPDFYEECGEIRPVVMKLERIK
ncbi:hypothetical protein ES705_15116 [subsurface metagenome]